METEVSPGALHGIGWGLAWYRSGARLLHARRQHAHAHSQRAQAHSHRTPLLLGWRRTLAPQRMPRPSCWLRAAPLPRPTFTHWASSVSGGKCRAVPSGEEQRMQSRGCRAAARGACVPLRPGAPCVACRKWCALLPCPAVWEMASGGQELYAGLTTMQVGRAASHVATRCRRPQAAGSHSAQLALPDLLCPTWRAGCWPGGTASSG